MKQFFSKHGFKTLFFGLLIVAVGITSSAAFAAPQVDQIPVPSATEIAEFGGAITAGAGQMGWGLAAVYALAGLFFLAAVAGVIMGLLRRRR